MEQGVLGTPKIWDKVSPENLARVSNLWLEWMSSNRHQNPYNQAYPSNMVAFEGPLAPNLQLMCNYASSHMYAILSY